MSEFETIWKRLIQLAVRAPSTGADVAAPVGFSTRVAARGIALRRANGPWAAWEWLTVKGLAVACAVTVASLLAAWPTAESVAAEDLADLADPLIVADLSR